MAGRTNTFKVTLEIITDAETAAEAVDIVRTTKWTWTVENLDTGDVTELDA